MLDGRMFCRSESEQQFLAKMKVSFPTLFIKTVSLAESHDAVVVIIEEEEPSERNGDTCLWYV